MKLEIGPLWERVRQDDPQAWGSLVRIYAGLVHTTALKAGLGTADAEDCAQHTWLALYRRRKSLRDPQALPAWLIRTTRRHAARMARRLGREVELTGAEVMADPAKGADELLARSEYHRAVKAALVQLDPRCRDLLTRLFGSDKRPSYGELAARMGVRANTLGPLRTRCLQRLREILRKMGWELH